MSTTARRYTLGVGMLLVLGAYGGNKPPPSSATPSATQSGPASQSSPTVATTPLSNCEPAVFHGTKDAAGASKIEVELDDFYFEPTIITGKAGQQVTLELFNEAQSIHNLSLKDQNIDQDVQAGQKGVTVTVKIPQSGSVVFICKYHVAQNMRGELEARSSGTPLVSGG